MPFKTRVVLVHFHLPTFDGVRVDPATNTASIVERLEPAGVGVDVRLYVGRTERRTIGVSSRVPAVSSSSSTRKSLRGTFLMLDLLYIVIGILGFVALAGITKACDRA